MPIYASARNGTDYTPAPAGTHAVVCCDVVDLGTLEVNYKGKTKTQHKIRVVWQMEEIRDDGKPFLVFKRYTLSLNEKAALRKDLESWRGKPFTAQELEQFDLEILIGVGCMVSVVHKDKEDGGTWANVAGVMKIPRGMTTPHIRDYVRVCEREEKTEAAGETAPDRDYPEITDDDVPF